MKDGLVWVTGMLATNGAGPVAHWLDPDLTNLGNTLTRCGLVASYAHGRAVVHLSLALRFATLCETCSTSKLASEKETAP